MSIPKVIHYCWFGGKELPRSAQKCIRSWKKYCPDYEIICWNEQNFDFSGNRYAREAYEAKKWAFVSDYVRLKVIYDHGGIYMDTDVELVKPLDDLLEAEGYMGYDGSNNVSTGLGFGMVREHPIMKALLEDYQDIPFRLPDGTFDTTPCPDRNIQTLVRLGLEQGKPYQELMGVRFYPPDYFAPMDFYTGKIRRTKNTYTIHHNTASWLTPRAKRTTRLKRIIGVRAYNFLYAKFLHRFKSWEW